VAPQNRTGKAASPAASKWRWPHAGGMVCQICSAGQRTRVTAERGASRRRVWACGLSKEQDGIQGGKEAATGIHHSCGVPIVGEGRIKKAEITKKKVLGRRLRGSAGSIGGTPRLDR